MVAPHGHSRQEPLLSVIYLTRNEGGGVQELRRDMELGGLDSRLERPAAIPLHSPYYLIDRIVLGQSQGAEVLYWEPLEVEPVELEHAEKREVGERAQRETLKRFADLSEAPAEKFTEFANDYGMLGLCEDHALPWTHNDRCLSAAEERISDWRDLARQVDATLRLAGMLHSANAQRGDTRDVLKSELWERVSAETAKPEDTEEAAGILSDTVNTYLDWAGIRLHLNWTDSSPSLELHGRPPFAQIASQMFSHVTGSRWIVACSYCGHVYRETRKPRADRGHYCPDCRTAKIPQRLARQRFAAEKV